MTTPATPKAEPLSADEIRDMRRWENGTGGIWHRFFATIDARDAEIARLTAERDAMAKARMEIFHYADEGMGCNHEPGDGSDGCGDIDDCMKHWLMTICEPKSSADIRILRELRK